MARLMQTGRTCSRDTANPTFSIRQTPSRRWRGAIGRSGSAMMVQALTAFIHPTTCEVNKYLRRCLYTSYNSCHVGQLFHADCPLSVAAGILYSAMPRGSTKFTIHISFKAAFLSNICPCFAHGGFSNPKLVIVLKMQER